MDREDGWARRGMHLRRVTVTGSRVRALMGADNALDHWLFLPRAVVSSAGHCTMLVDIIEEHVLLVTVFGG